MEGGYGSTDHGHLVTWCVVGAVPWWGLKFNKSAKFSVWAIVACIRDH